MEYLFALVLALLFWVIARKFQNQKFTESIVIGIAICIALVGFVVLLTHDNDVRQQAAQKATSLSKSQSIEDNTDYIDEDDDYLGEENETSDESAEEASTLADEEASESSSSAAESSAAAAAAASSAAASSSTAVSEAASYSAATSYESSSSTATYASSSAATDTRSTQSTNARNYESKPVPSTAESETVYVNATIPGRYHKDPNCRGLLSHGGGTAMTLAQAQANGYVAYCAYERYGN